MTLINKNKILYPKLSYKTCGLCFDVHNKYGRYLNEKQYCDALEKEFIDNDVKYFREKELKRGFLGEKPRRNIVDFIIQEKIILEIKAKRFITKSDYYQVKRYLQSAKLELSIIVNFRQKYLNPKRILNKLDSNHSNKNL